MNRHIGEAARRFSQHLRTNGWRWTALHSLARAAGAAQAGFAARARELERRHDLPGTNSVAANRAVWSAHDWSRGGEEWTASPSWRASVVETFVHPYLATDATGAAVRSVVVEIGPGAGRWTQTLQAAARELYLVDITDVTLQLCRERLGNPPDTHYVRADGRDLPGVPSAGVDFVWSFDVFVHVAPADQRSYLEEIARVLRPGAFAVVHHGGTGGAAGGWRSATTAELFAGYATNAGLHVVGQHRSWGPAHEHLPPVAGDVVTVLQRMEPVLGGAATAQGDGILAP